MDLFNDLVISIVANCLSAPLVAAGLIVVVWLAYTLPARRRLLRLFGITAKNNTLTIYVSRLEIVPGGTISVGELHGQNDVNKGYSGAAINYLEYQGAEELRSLIRDESLARLPQWGQKLIFVLLGIAKIELVRVEPQIVPSPLYVDKDRFRNILPSKLNLLEKLRVTGLDTDSYFALIQKQLKQEQTSAENAKATERKSHPDNMIILGDQLYNLQYQLRAGEFAYEFRRDAGERHLFVNGYRVPGRPAREVGVIDRLVKQQPGEYCVIVCAGTGSRATKACALYLAANWNQLAKLEFPRFLAVTPGRGHDDGEVLAGDATDITETVYEEARKVALSQP